MAGVELEFPDEPAAFLEVAGEWLARDPVLNTVIATHTEGLRDAEAGGVPIDPGVPRWWVVARDDAGDIIGVGMRTAPFDPYPPYLLPMPREAAVALAQAVVARGEEVRGCNGALPAAQVFAEECARLTGGRAEVAIHLRLFELGDLVVPPAPPGRLRRARQDDVGLCLAWYDAFARDADEQAGRPAGSHHDVAETESSMRRRIEQGRIWLWEDEHGEVAHLTAASPPAYGVARVGPVYTPTARRGRGYASATVAAVSRAILAEGARACLFTDQANPTSNRIYESIGYRPVVDMANLLVRPPRRRTRG